MSKVKKGTHSSEDLSSSSCTSSSLSSDEETDAQDLKPIKDYLSNRRELARQLFKSVKPEKIRMMLPQALKKINLDELEEWCASELSGMSKTRILCILNGKEMLESSDTSESDDSGPSLEIISDTEEWFTDEDLYKKEEGGASGKAKSRKDKIKVKGKSQVQKKGHTDKSKLNAKVNNKEKCDDKHKDVKIKTENEKETNKEKEGDSLLDLLELEMRARAIRALIRKEEDIMPTVNTFKLDANNKGTNINSSNRSMQDEQKGKEDCRRQLEKIINSQQGNNADDEDVVLVVQPTPTIELLSSDSEAEGHTGARVNQKLENERVLEANKNADRAEERSGSKNASDTGAATKEDKGSQDTVEAQNDLDTSKHKVPTRVSSNNIEVKSAQPVITKSDGSGEKKRKLNKRSHVKEHLKTATSEQECSGSKSSNVQESTEDATRNVPSAGSNTVENIGSTSANIELNLPVGTEAMKSAPLTGEKITTKLEEAKQKSVLDEEKPVDLEEIIDLDDYSDDMEDMENYGTDKMKNKQADAKGQKSRTEATSQKTNSTETWASRYYQTDDVQSVIKESKIQSEIRKRLRERQRLSKLKSPNLGSPSSTSMAETASDKIIQKPMGSVDEYLALKRTAPANLSGGNGNSSINVTEIKSACSDLPVAATTVVAGDQLTTADSENENASKQINTNDAARTDTGSTAQKVQDINPVDKTNPT